MWVACFGVSSVSAQNVAGPPRLVSRPRVPLEGSVVLLELRPSAGDSVTTVRGELAEYGAGLEHRPFVLVLSKIDLLPPEMAPGLAAEWRRRLGGDSPVLAVSSATGVGVDRLAREIFEHVPAEEPAAAAADAGETIADHAVYRPGQGDGYRVERSGDHLFRIEGPAVERLVDRHDLENRDALEYIEGRLRSMGGVRALETAGFEPGDEIEIGEVAFALYPGVPQPE